VPFFLSILANIAGALASLTMLVFILAGSANSSERQLLVMKLWCAGIAVGGLACFIGAIALMAGGRPWPAALVGLAPAAFLVVVMLYLAITK
jgi:hypothetical protein